MAKKTPAELKLEAEAVSAVIAQGRKKPLNFALVLGDEGVVLEAHAIKSEDVMLRAAKANGGSARGTTGILNVTGKLMELTCSTEDFPASLPRIAKRHFKALGIAIKIVMKLPNGEMLTDGDEDEEDPAAPSEVAASDAPPLTEDGKVGADEPDGMEDAPDPKAELTQRLRMCVQPVTDFNIKNKDVGGRLITALKTARDAIGKDDLEQAEKLIAAIERTVGIGGAGAVPFAPSAPVAPKQPDAPPKPEDIEQQRQALMLDLAKLADPLRLFLKRGEPSLTGKAQQLLNAFTTDIKGTDMKRCGLLLSTLKNFVEAHLPNLPVVSEAERAKDAIAAAKGVAPEARYTQAAGLQGKYAKGSVAARQAFDGFAAVLGDQPVTPELMTRAKAEIDTVKTEMAAPQKRLEQAKAMADGPQKVAALEAANKDIAAVQARIDAAIAFEKAARCKDALTKALTAGPLSAKSGQKLPDETAAALITAYTRDPDFAGAALETASTATHPEVLAKGLPMLMDLRESGFASGAGSFDPVTADTYAKNLLKMGGSVGQDFFDRMPGYMKKGRQFRPDPLNEGGKTGAALAQHRSVALAERLVGDDGKVAPGSRRLSERVNHMLFSPDSLKTPMPGMNEYALNSMKMFEDPDIAKKANKILGDLPDAPKGGSQKLVNTALGKAPTAPVSKREMQTSVMASMLKSLDQGPVGSCFSTAPARRMRETDPMKAMSAYAEIASTGKLKPPHGVKMPVVTSIHPGEDPIMRSWEYTLASSAAQDRKSSEREDFDNLMDGAIDDLSGDIFDLLLDKGENKGGFKGLGMVVKAAATQKGRTKQLKKLISDSFDFMYDPVVDSGPSADGSSTDGRYILTNKKTRAEVRTQGDFITQMTAIACDAFGIDPTSPEATEVRNLVSADAFLDMVRKKKMDGGTEKVVEAPWLLEAGGLSAQVSKTLYGKSGAQEQVADESDDTVDEGTRTRTLMTAMLGGFLDDPQAMKPMRTVGQHAFNGLPKDPSLAPLLKGGKAKLAENMQREVVDKAATASTTALEVERAQYVFDQMVKALPGPQDDPANLPLLTNGAATHRPTGPMTPAQIEAAFQLAAHAYLDAESQDYGDPAKKLLKFKAEVKGKAQGALIKETGMPEFVIADTNWGDSENHTFFVIAPDPVSGEPVMFKKEVPPGTLKPVGREWIDEEWAFVK